MRRPPALLPVLFVLVVLWVCLVPPAAAQLPGPAATTLDAWFQPSEIIPALNETRIAELRIEASLQCAPGLAAPQSVTGYLTNTGWSGTPAYWRITPSTIEIPWEAGAAGEWHLDARVPFHVEADDPAPERHAGNTTSTLQLRGASLGAGGDACSALGYSWPATSAPLIIQVPVGILEREDPEITPGPGVLAVLALTLSSMVLIRRHRHRAR